MSLDANLIWLGKPSRDMVSRFHNQNISNRIINMNYIDQEDADNPIYKYKKKFFVPETIIRNEYDYDAIREYCGMPQDAKICHFSNDRIGFGEAVNVGEVKYFDINWEKFDKPFKRDVYFYLSDDLYYWSNNYDIQELFNEAYPECYCDYNQKYEMYNCGCVPVTKSLFNKIKKIDPLCNYTGSLKNVFYRADW